MKRILLVVLLISLLFAIAGCKDEREDVVNGDDFYVTIYDLEKNHLDDVELLNGDIYVPELSSWHYKDIHNYQDTGIKITVNNKEISVYAYTHTGYVRASETVTQYVVRASDVKNITEPLLYLYT